VDQKSVSHWLGDSTTRHATIRFLYYQFFMLPELQLTAM